MLDEKKALKLVKDLQDAVEAEDRATKELNDANLRVADSHRTTLMAQQALHQFLGLK